MKKKTEEKNRCQPSGDFILVLVIGVPADLYALYWVTKEAIISGGLFEYYGIELLLCLMLVIVAYAGLIGTLALLVYCAWWSWAEWSLTEQGVILRYFTGRTRVVRWDDLEDVCVCKMKASYGYPIRIFRCSTDKAFDLLPCNQKNIGILGLGWPRWLDIDFIAFHHKKIVIFPYSEETLDEVRQYYPNIRFYPDQKSATD